MRIFIPLLLVMIITPLHAQYHEIPPWQDSEQLPEWVRLMTQETVNVLAVDESFARFHEGLLLEKNQFTQYYKRWRRWAEGKYDADGWLRLPSAAEERLLEQYEGYLAVQYLRLRSITFESGYPFCRW